MHKKQPDNLDYYISNKTAKIRVYFRNVVEDFEVGNLATEPAVNHIKNYCTELKILLKLHMPDELRTDIVNLLSKMSQTIKDINAKSNTSNIHNDDLVR